MSEEHELKEPEDWLADKRAQAWLQEHLPEMQQSVSGQRLLYQSLVLAFVVGLAAHVGGYMLLASRPGEPLGLLADLLHALGWSLWTGVVVTVFVQVIPELKRRQIKQALDTYEALQREAAHKAGPKAGRKRMRKEDGGVSHS